MEYQPSVVLNALLEITSDGVLIVSHKGEILRFNQQFAELWKIPESIQTTHDDSVFLSFILNQLLNPDAFLKKVTELYNTPHLTSKDTIEFKDGRYFERLSSPFLNGEEIGGRIWRFRDVTKQKQSEETFRAITDLSPDIISIIDHEGKLVFNSKATNRIHGYGDGELLGKNTFEHIHPEDQAEVSRSIELLVSGAQDFVSVQYRYRNKDHSYTWMEATGASQLNNPAIRGIVTVSRDITTRKKLEEELHSTIRNRDDFISMISHELNTPVSLFKLKLQLLKKKQDTSHGPPEIKDYDLLIGQAASMQALIQDLLSVTKMRTGRFSFSIKPLNLSEQIETSIHGFQEQFSDNGISLNLNLDKNLMINGDRLRIDQLLKNLISNVIKYAPQSSLSISLKSNGSFAELSLKDEGPGISKSKQESIFELFHRVDDEKYKPGLGIGLFISKHIVDMHGGVIFVNSDGKKGSEFVIRLPLK